MTIVKKYIAKVSNIYNQISGVYMLDLQSIDRPFKYEPGQFLHFALDEYDPSSQWPDSRCFSIQTNPMEDSIKITYSVKGPFTKRMQQELYVGKFVTLKLPYGNLFSQEHNKTKTVFIAGGTGITPFLSLFTDSSFSNYSKPKLFAGFRNSEMNLYFNELEKAKQINPDLEVSFVYQDQDGILNIEEIFKNSDKNASFFISGPPVMINAFKTYLFTKGVEQNQIKTDDWE